MTWLRAGRGCVGRYGPALTLALALALGGCAGTPHPAPSLPRQVMPPSAAPPGNAAADPRQAFVTVALAMRGRPYRYGGADPEGFDCSGLVEYAARSVGIRVPRTTAGQFQVGTPVERNELQDGDLVFMRLDKGLHVGIVSGPGEFVHAPSAGGSVRSDHLGARPYAAAFVGARRLTPPPPPRSPP